MAKSRSVTEAMPTIGGMSVRKEIDARMDALRTTTRTSTIEECIAFLEQSGHATAAVALHTAAFNQQADSHE